MDQPTSRIDRYDVFRVDGTFAENISRNRPDAREVYVLHWPDGDIVIPWLEGQTAKESIIEWAKKAKVA